MKKIVCVVLAVLFVFAFVGCSNGGTFSEKNYLSENGQIRSIIIDVADRELNIGLSSDGQISVNYFDSEKQYLEISVSESNELVIRLAYDRSWTDFIGVKPDRKYRGITVLVPENLLASLNASTTNGDIKVSCLDVSEEINLCSNGGDVICERVGAVGKISLKAKNGDIRGTVAGGLDEFSNQKGRLQSAVEQGGRRQGVFCRLQQRRHIRRICKINIPFFPCFFCGAVV